MSITRDEIARLCAEHDKFVAELDDWKAQRDAQAQALVAKSEGEALMYRTHENNGSQGPTVQEAEAVCDEPSAFSELQADVLAIVINAERDREHDELQEALAQRDEKIAQLSGKLDAALQLIGYQNVNDDRVVDLPRGFIRRRNDAA